MPKLAQEHRDLAAVVGRVIESLLDELGERIGVLVKRARFQQGLVGQPRDEPSPGLLQLRPARFE